MKRPCKPAAPRRRERVLVVTRADGFVEVFGNRNVDVHIVNRLHVEDERGDLSTRIDEYLTETLPRPYRELYWPSKRRKVGNVECVTPERALDTLRDLAVIRQVRSVEESRRRPPEVIEREKRRMV